MFGGGFGFEGEDAGLVCVEEVEGGGVFGCGRVGGVGEEGQEAVACFEGGYDESRGEVALVAAEGVADEGWDWVSGAEGRGGREGVREGDARAEAQEGAVEGEAWVGGDGWSVVWGGNTNLDQIQRTESSYMLDGAAPSARAQKKTAFI